MTIPYNREKEQQFWDDIFRKERVFISNTPRIELIDNIESREHWWEELIGKIENNTILDIGCGNTYFMAYWQLTGNEAYGSDISPEAVESNNLLHNRLGLKPYAYIASSETIEHEDSSFDIVHMRWVIHHIPPELMDETIEEIRRVLKPQGKLVICETNYLYPFRWIVQTPLLRKFNFLRTFTIRKGWLDPEEKALSNQGYIDLLERHGFKIQRIGYDCTVLYYPISLLTQNRFIRHITKGLDSIMAKLLPNRFSKDIKIIAAK